MYEDTRIRKKLEVYTEVVYTSIHFYTLPLVGVYTSPGRWGAHYTTVHYPPGKKIGSVYKLLDYTLLSPASLGRVDDVLVKLLLQQRQHICLAST